jgi:glycosyltransferase involved in cell wall biosynthesis
MKLSVLVVTYNHEEYIAQAIDSVLMQETTFVYEIIVGEDDSNDNTRAIVKEYKKRHPEKIRLFLNDRKNVIYINGRPTGRWNFTNCVKHATGEYVALLEGDDYWTSKHKLQKQVVFLDNHPECAMCIHNTLVLYEDKARPPHKALPPGRKRISNITDILVKNDIQTSSVMFRNGLVCPFPDWFYDLKMGDWALHILCAERGNIGYIDEVMSAYRVHGGGEWSRLSEVQRSQWRIRARRAFDAHLKYQYSGIIRGALAKEYCASASIYLQLGDLRRAGDHVVKCLAEDPSGKHTGRRNVIGLLLRIYVAKLHRELSARFPRVLGVYDRLKGWVVRT